MLDVLLAGLAEQEGKGAFTWSARVVDNDKNASARNIVEKHRARRRLSIEYLIEPIQNISMARNRAVAGANADYVAMIDDDERPERDWLWQLWTMMRVSNADGVLGPVYPTYPEGAPTWLRKSGLCERPSHQSGESLKYHETRTGNVLVRACLFNEEKVPFSPEFGRGGGEDIDFFRRQMHLGRRFVWCHEAKVYEKVSEQRWTIGYYCRRQLRLGGLLGRRQKRAGELRAERIFRSVARLSTHCCQVVCSAPFGKHIYGKPLAGICYHVGYLGGACGILFVEKREELKGKEDYRDAEGISTAL